MIFYFVLAGLFIVFDQLSKWLVVQFMSLYESIPIIESFFYITSHRNRGAAFGILQGQQWLFIGVTSVVVIGIIYYLITMKQEPTIVKLSFTFILAGSIGNFIDRIRMGEVVDFFHFQFGSYHFPIFNIADSVIVIGVILLLWSQFFATTHHRSEQQEAEDSQ